MRIEYFEFQPFESRQGKDTVYAVRLRGAHYQDINVWKSLLRILGARYYATKRSPWRNAGGWLSQYHRWFVEKIVWPDVESLYADLGIELRAVEVVSMARLRLESIKSQRQQDIKRYGTSEPSQSQILAEYRRTLR